MVIKNKKTGGEEVIWRVKKGEIQPFLDWNNISPGGVIFKKRGESYFPETHGIPVGIQFVSQEAMKSGFWLKADRPWEELALGGYTTVIYENGKYRLWYESCARDQKSDFDSKLCYAESNDGYNWNKPDLNLIEFRGRKKNNIVYDKTVKGGYGYHGGTVFVDPVASPAERYKIMYLGGHYPEKFGPDWLETIHMRGAVSSDGIHWRPLKNNLLDNYCSDTQTTTYYNTKSNSYVAYLRGGSDYYGRRRAIMRSETIDFQKWPRPECVLSLGANYHPSHDLYTNAHVIYPGRDDLHLMFPAQYNREIDTLEVYLATSSDGIRWEYFGENPVIPLSKGEGSIYAGCGVVPLKENEAAVPYCVYPFTHNFPVSLYTSGAPSSNPIEAQKGYAGRYGWAIWKRDRFVAVEAKTKGEFFLFPMLIPQNGSLLLNARVEKWGGMGIQIEDTEGRPIKNYRFSECDPISGDFFDKPVTWKGKRVMPAAINKELRIHVKLQSAKIYAFKIA
ncbi:MAG: hypothetical protein V2A65_04715 [Candidatus Omnitrophota bacterium]